MKRIILHNLNRNEKLLKHGIIVLIGSLVTGFINFFYQIYMGRALGPVDYGILGALFSVVYIIMFSISPIGTVISKFVSVYRAENNYGKIHKLFRYAGLRLLIIGVILFILFFSFSGLISDYLKISSSLPVVFIGLFAMLNIMMPIFSGVLNGLQRFYWNSFLGALGSVFKLAFGILLVYMGFKVNGAVLSLSIALLILIVIYFIPLRSLFAFEKKDINHVDIFKYALPAFLVIFFSMLLVNIDTILVKHQFNALEAGYYAVASMLSKVILFGTSSFAMVMFPKVSDLYSQKKEVSSLLKNTLFYTLLIVSVPILVYFIAPTFIIRLLYGPDYSPVAGLLPLMGIALGLFALSNVLVLFNLAVNRLKTLYFLIIAFVLEVGSIILFSSTLLEVIKVILIVNILLFILLLFYTRKEFGFNGVLT